MIEFLIIVLALTFLISAIHERKNCILQYVSIDLATGSDQTAILILERIRLDLDKEIISKNAISKEYYDSIRVHQIPYIQWKSLYQEDWEDRLDRIRAYFGGLEL